MNLLEGAEMLSFFCALEAPLGFAFLGARFLFGNVITISSA